jgi:hypothetical protein
MVNITDKIKEYVWEILLEVEMFSLGLDSDIGLQD